MRNLKRALSLALASVMLLGMMVVGSNAAIADVDPEKHNVEALEVLKLVKAMVGDGTNINPDQKVTRNEAAVVISNLLPNVKANYAGSHPFTDVPSWADASVGVLYAEGITGGISATEYGGNNTLTASQIGLMVMKALGYFQYAEDFEGNWQKATIKKAAELNLFKGVSCGPNTEMTRNDFAQVIFNALMMNKVSNVQGQLVVDSEGKWANKYTYYAYGDVLEDALFGDDAQSLKKAESISCDEYGRPGYQWTYKGDEAFIPAQPVATYVNEFDKDIADEMIDDNADAFKNVIINYNGFSSDGCDELADLYTPVGDAKNGMTIELYNMDDDAETIEYIAVVESNLAIVKDVTLTEGETKGTVTIEVIAWSGDYEKTVTDNLKVTDDDYDALCGYDEDDVLIVTMGKDFSILNIEEPAAVSGKISKVVLGDYTCTTTATIDGKEYGVNNMFKNAKSILAVSKEGTLYLDAQGNAIGWVDEAEATVTKPVVYVVNYYKNEVKTTNELTGIDEATKTTYWALCVNADGEVVKYQMASAPYSLGNKEYVSRDVMAEVTISYNETLKADVATFETLSDQKITSATKATDIKINGSYYTDAIKYIFIDDEMEDLEVVVKTGAQAVGADIAKWYDVQEIKNDNNTTTSFVFVDGAYSEADVTVSGVVYAAEGESNVTASVLYTDKDGKDATGYEHVVYVDGVKTTIVTEYAAPLNGFITLTEDADVADIYAASAKTADNLLDTQTIANMYNGLISISGVEGLTDVDVTGVTVVNLSSNTKVPTDATKLSDKDTVALVLNADCDEIVMIYVIASSRA